MSGLLEPTHREVLYGGITIRKLGLGGCRQWRDCITARIDFVSREVAVMAQGMISFVVDLNRSRHGTKPGA
jgi:hypothetical protein